ncbi:MAG: branched-chain amino acid ABC transporter permease [Gammaproteobacteria bacterium]|nr:branched-chain amino acid ABC transporter permease [Gammaproteobacteria bacterium]
MLVAIVILATAPAWAGRADLRLINEMLLYLSLACLWNLLAGFAGLVSVGQQAYVGLGGYLLFSMAMFADIPPIYSLPLIAVISMLVSIPVAGLIFRLRGAYFAIGTWVIAEVFRLSAAQITALGGGSGTSLPVGIVKSIADSKAGRDSAIYWSALLLTVVIVSASVLLLRSRHGIALKAIRDNELAASSLGIAIWRTKFFVYVLTAGLTAVVGALIFLQKLRITPDAAFNVNDWTAFVIFIVVIGGIGTLEGPIIGTLVFFLLRETLADLGTTYLIILGVVAIVIMLYAPQGLWGFLRKRLKLELFPITPRVVHKRD